MASREDHPEGAWVDETIVITGRKLVEFRSNAPEGLENLPVLDKTGTPVGRVAKYVESGGPDDLPELFIMPTEPIYERMGEERGGNTLGIPADNVTYDREKRALKLTLSLDELFAVNRERGGRPKDLDVATELGVEPRE